jgi:hypothetical protein
VEFNAGDVGFDQGGVAVLIQREDDEIVGNQLLSLLESGPASFGIILAVGNTVDQGVEVRVVPKSIVVGFGKLRATSSCRSSGGVVWSPT